MNPLSKFTKVENVYVKLCSSIALKYPDGVLSNPVGECGVCARSSRDELMLNNPDALMNGQAVINVIENCVPNVEDASKLYVNDVEQLLIAIKLATKETSYSIETKCPECNKHGAFERDLNWLTNTVTMLEEVPELILEDVGGLLLKFRPHTWQEHSDFGVRMFQSQKRSQMIELMEDASEEEKMKIFSEIVEEMTQLNFDMIVAKIDSIEIPSDELEVVTDKEFIGEWLGQQPSYIIRQIQEQVLKLDDYGVSHEMDVACSECQHEWTMKNVVFDPSYFFGLA